MNVIYKLRDSGVILIVEHNLDVINCRLHYRSWTEGGERGGYLQLWDKEKTLYQVALSS